MGNRKVAELFQNGQLQAMLKGNKPSDPSEKQADELAEKALNESEIDAFMKETEALQDHILATGEPPERNQHRFAGLLGKGQKLDKKTKDYFEPRFGVDFAQILIHKNAKANEMAEALNARAFTQKNDIVFNKGEYQPDTPEGKKLLAHELVHTLQPGEGIQRKEKEVDTSQANQEAEPENIEIPEDDKFRNEKWVNYQNKYYINEPDSTGSGKGLYLKMPDAVNKKYPTSLDFWNKIVDRWNNQEANYRLIDLSDITGPALKYEYDYLSDEHQKQIDEMMNANPDLSKDALAQSFGSMEASMTKKQLDDKISQLSAAHDPDHQIPALKQMKLMADKVQISPKKLTAMIDMILADPRLKQRTLADGKTVTYCNVGTLIGNYLLGAEMHRITGKHGFMNGATELIQKTREAALRSEETGVYALTPEIIQFAANLGFPTMAGGEHLNGGTSHVAIGAINNPEDYIDFGVRMGGPGGAGGNGYQSFHDYTFSSQWGANVNLGPMEYFFIAP